MTKARSQHKHTAGEARLGCDQQPYQMPSCYCHTQRAFLEICELVVVEHSDEAPCGTQLHSVKSGARLLPRRWQQVKHDARF